MDSIQKFLDHAHTACKASPGTGLGVFKLGAVLVKDNKRIISAGFNQLKTHPKLAEFSDWPYIHAETACIFKRGLKNCKGLDLYVVRLGKKGDRKLAKPCSICMHFIDEARINKVYYSINDRKYGIL